jgi:hypothetical protein
VNDGIAILSMGIDFDAYSAVVVDNSIQAEANIKIKLFDTQEFIERIAFVDDGYVPAEVIHRCLQLDIHQGTMIDQE